MRWFRHLLIVALAAFGILWLGRHFGRRVDATIHDERVAGVQGLLNQESIYSGYHDGRYHRSPAYWWLSAKELAVVRSGPTGTYEAWRVPADSGEVKPLLRLNPLLATAGRDQGVFHWSPSPDRRWVAVLESLPERQVAWRMVELEGTGTISWTNLWDGSLPVWFHDSRGLIQWRQVAGELAATVFLREQNRSIRFDPKDIQRQGGQTISSTNASLVVVPNLEEDTERFQMAALSGHSNEWLLTIHSFPMPSDLRVSTWQAEVQPGGAELLWRAEFRRNWPSISIGFNPPRLHRAPVSKVTFWGSTVEGLNPREILRLPAGEMVRWATRVPGQDHLSYFMDATLWKTKADNSSLPATANRP